MADAQLPSIAEILEATEVLSSQDGAKVEKVKDKFLVKYGARVSRLEADTMRYVSANSDTPVPKLFGTITDPNEPEINYIVMEFIEGKCLDAIWPDLSTSEKEDVKMQLKAALNSLRKMPDQGYIGSVGRQKCIDGVFYTGETYVLDVNGPFETEIEMNEGVLRRVAETRPASAIRLFRTIFSNMPTHRIVFTHADLQARNIIVKRTTSEHGGPNTMDLTIIDWEMSGWYPEYWEFCNSIIFNTFHAEWLDIAQDIMDVYTNEYLLMQRIRNICSFERSLRSCSFDITAAALAALGTQQPPIKAASLVPASLTTTAAAAAVSLEQSLRKAAMLSLDSQFQQYNQHASRILHAIPNRKNHPKCTCPPAVLQTF